MSDPVLSIRGLERSYVTGAGKLTVLRGVDLDVEPERNGLRCDAGKRRTAATTEAEEIGAGVEPSRPDRVTHVHRAAQDQVEARPGFARRDQALAGAAEAGCVARARPQVRERMARVRASMEHINGNGRII